MEGGSVRYNDDGLRRLASLFAKTGTVVRVGILTGPKMARKYKTNEGNGESKTNAQIGAEQEYGVISLHIPPRSFIYKPTRSPKARKRIVADAAEGLQRELKRGETVNAPDSFYGKIGAGLVATVQDAFDASGPGWKPLSPVTIKRRRTRKLWPRMGTKPLIDTSEMRNSVSYKIFSGGGR